MPARNTLARVVDRVLTRLRNAIRERNFTQLEVQEALGWGRSYISQLVTKQKTLRIEQILLILNVIGVEPEDFFGEIFQFGTFGPTAGPQQRRRQARRPSELFQSGAKGSMEDDLRRLEMLLGAIVAVLLGKGFIDAGNLEDAIDKAKRNPDVRISLEVRVAE